MNKQKIIGFLAGCGLNAYLLRKLRRGTPQLIVLAYHRILSLNVHDRLTCDEVSRIVLDAEEFEQQVSWIAAHFNVVTLDSILDGECQDKTAVLFTFDDGYKDVITTAYPILNKYGFSATVFLTGRHVAEQKPTWIQQVHYLLDHRQKNICRVKGSDLEYNLDRRNDFAECLFAIKKKILEVSRQDFVDFLLTDLEKQLCVELPKDFTHNILLDELEISFLSSKEWTFGCHSYSHFSLSGMLEEEVYLDLKMAADVMTYLPGYRPVLALPFGLGTNYNQRILDTAFKLGFTNIFSCCGRSNSNYSGRGVVHRVISESHYRNFFKFVILNGKDFFSFLPSQ